MSIVNVVGKNADPRPKGDSKSTMQITLSDITQLPNNFHYWNGDEYTGEFALIREKQALIMQGRGVYTTSDGQIYEGVWENDYLKDDCKITFPDKSVFTGGLDEMLITGPGKYSFKENIQVEGNFFNNNIIGRVYLKDPNQNYWRGEIEEGEDYVSFYPVHPFWRSVVNMPRKGYPLFYGEGEEEGNG